MTTPHHRTAGALLILLLTSICATAQLNELPRTRSSPAYANVESKSGNISGTVVNESGQPLANAEVNLQPASPGGDRAKPIKTNREGVFKFSGLRSGSYYVSASMPAYVPRSPSYRPDSASSEDSVTLVLLKGGVITGTVTNPKGDPVVEIGIKVEMVVDDRGMKSPSITYQSVTDDQGVYRVYGLPTGTYIVAADAAVNYSPTNVNAFAIDMPTYATSSNREEADEFSVRVGEETTVDIRYRAERGNTISGVVNGLPDGNRGYAVSLTSLAEVTLRRDGYFREANGEFAIEGVPDGDYHLVASAYWNDKENRVSESMAINIRGADIEGLQLTPAALASLSGAVILKELKEAMPECTDKRQPQFSEVNVTAWHRVIQDGKKKPQFVWRRSSESPNAQGNFTFRELAANEYYFGVRLPGPQWYLESIAFVPQTHAGKPTDATRSWTTVKPGDQLSGLTFTLAQGAAQVRGEITLAEGQKLPDKLSVYLVPAEAAQAENALRYSVATVSTAGHFWFGNVMPGRYWIMAQRGTDDIRDEISKLRLPDAAETRSSLRHTAEQKKTEIELKPCQDFTFQLPL